MEREYLGEHLQRITHPSSQYQKNNILVMEMLQQITNPIPITYKFLVITKTHLSLIQMKEISPLPYYWWLNFGNLLKQPLPKKQK